MASQEDPRNKGKGLRTPARHNPPPTMGPQMSQQNNEPIFFDYNVNTSEHLVAGGLNPPGAGDLVCPAPPYQTTNTPSAASSSTSDQADFLFSRVATYPTRVQSREPPDAISSRGQEVFPYSTLQPAATSSVVVADWQQQQQQQLYNAPEGFSNDGSPALSAQSIRGGGRMIGYASQQQSTGDPYMGNYVSPAPTQNYPQVTFGYYEYDWSGADDGAVSMGTTSPSALMSPISQSFDMFASPTEGGIGEGTGGWQQQEQPQTQKPQLTDATGAGAGAGRSSNKRTRRPRVPPVPILAHPTPSGQSSGGSSGSKSKLRTASRTSKNMHTRAEETPQERKTRNSHNLVEKQYRNRLNMQFEALMNSLPESMRSPTRNSMSGDDSEGLDAGEKRLSKAQVLDMAMRHIRSLETDRDRLTKENGELRENVSKLREMCYGVGLGQDDDGRS